MITPIFQTTENKKKSVLLFIHGFIGSQESWLGNSKDVRIPEHLYSYTHIKDNYDFALFSYYSELTTFFDNSYTVYRKVTDKLPIIKTINRWFFTKKVEFKANLQISQIARLLKTDSYAYLKDYERIVIIAHSMGGLVAKSYIVNLLEEANENKDKNNKEAKKAQMMASKIAGYISIAVPHNGSILANIGEIILNNPHVKDLASLENFIYSLTSRWLFAKNLPLTAYFQCSSDNIVVENSSAGYDIRNIKPEIFEYDHFTVLSPNEGDTILKTLYDTIINFETEDPKEYYYDLINSYIGNNNDGEAAIKSFVVDHENEGFRSKKFQELKNKAECSITIMGVGITNIQESEILINLNKGISVRLLMMNPNILLEHFKMLKDLPPDGDFDYLSAFDMMLKNDHLGNFFMRTNYNGRLIEKFNGLKTFVAKIQQEYNSNPEKGNIEMQVFNSFIPISFTSINTFNINDKPKIGVEEFIVEFALPYSDRRIHIPISKQSDLKMFTSFIDSIEQLWIKSEPADKVTINKNFQNG